MKVLLIDPLPMVRAAITGLIEQHFADFRVQGVDTAAAARATLQQYRPGLVLLNLRMHGGAELLQYIHSDNLSLPVVVISGTDRADDALHALGAGAMGYVPEHSELSTLVQALHLVLEGGTYAPMMALVPGLPTPQATLVPPDWTHLALTPRQKTVLNLLIAGQSNKLIARELGLSVDTVKDHVAAILKALGVTSRGQAVAAAMQQPR